MRLHTIALFIVLLLLNSTTKAQNGVVKNYYPDKTLESQISYTDAVFDGPALWYYPNGNLKTEKNFSLGKLNGWVREYYDTGLLKEEYYVESGILDGAKKIYYDNGALSEILKYEKGMLVNRTSFDYDPLYKATPDLYQAGNRQIQNLNNHKEEFFCDVEQCPVPRGGFKTIQENLVYPEHALMYGLEGTVTLVAAVDQNGEVTETQVIKHLGLGCDEAAQNAVKQTSFIPGENGGKVVVSHATINVVFKLPEGHEQGKKLSDQVAAVSVPDTTGNPKSEGVKEKLRVLEKTVKLPEVKPEIPVITCDAEICPEPEGGMAGLMKNVEIPAIAKRLKLRGEIVISANVDEYGLVRDTKIDKGIGYGCDDAVEMAVLKTRFIPAKKSGMNAGSKIKIIYPFKYDQ